MPFLKNDSGLIVPINLLKTKSFYPKSSLQGKEAKDKEAIKSILNHFSIGYSNLKASFVSVNLITYTFKPNIDVKLNKISELLNDFALALNAWPIRIIIPVPGTSLVSIEVPNKEGTILGLLDELQTEEFKNSTATLPIPMGRDSQNKSVVVDLTTMPHLMIGGATNSGKSVFINSLIISLMTKFSPEELKFILVDPKRVELPMYNGIPNLVFPVITESNKALEAVKWCVDEIDRRYSLLNEAGISTISTYNKTKTKLPYIVFIVDEMADFSLSSLGCEIIDGMIKILQRGMTVGIHLILSTSRPCADTYPPLLQINFSSQLVGSLASLDDSKFILGMSGGEKLLGQGDMLYKSKGDMSPIRLQIPSVSDDDIINVVNYLKKTNFKEKEDDIKLIKEKFDKKFPELEMIREHELNKAAWNAFSKSTTGKVSSVIYLVFAFFSIFIYWRYYEVNILLSILLAVITLFVVTYVFDKALINILGIKRILRQRNDEEIKESVKEMEKHGLSVDDLVK